MTRLSATFTAAALASALSCSRGGDSETRNSLFSRGNDAAAPAPFDWSRPASALDMGAEEVASRLGSFEWAAAVDWTVERQGEDAQRVHAAEHHLIRQFPTGEMTVVSEIDPGLGKGSETGKEMIYAGGLAYGRALHAPFRERPTDHGRDARRYRDETFHAALSVARLFGSALAWSDAGAAELLARPARRFKLSLARDALAIGKTPRPAHAPEPDADTKRRLAFLDGRVPLSLDGEVLLDAATGAPLQVRITGALGASSDAKVRTTVDLLAQVRSIGGAVAAVLPPKGALPDERKPAGVAGALEAAGFKKAEKSKTGHEEPDDAGD